MWMLDITSKNMCQDTKCPEREQNGYSDILWSHQIIVIECMVNGQGDIVVVWKLFINHKLDHVFGSEGLVCGFPNWSWNNVWCVDVNNSTGAGYHILEIQSLLPNFDVDWHWRHWFSNCEWHRFRKSTHLMEGRFWNCLPTVPIYVLLCMCCINGCQAGVRSFMVSRCTFSLGGNKTNTSQFDDFSEDGNT